MWSIKSVSILVCLPFTIDEVDTTKTTNQQPQYLQLSWNLVLCDLLVILVFLF